MLSNEKQQISLNAMSDDMLKNVGLLLVMQKIEELKAIGNELLDIEAKRLDDCIGLTVDEAAKFLKKGRAHIFAMCEENILEWRLCGAGRSEALRGKKLISVESLLRYKKELWSKDFDGDGFYTNVQGIQQRARVTIDEAKRLGVIKK